MPLNTTFVATVLTALPIRTASQGESFFYTPSQLKAFLLMHYTKPPTLIDDQIALLKSRGLIINNEAYARHCLGQLSYYRLSGYWWPLQSDKQLHIFKSGSHFETVMQIYEFDSDLRKILFYAIEEIEIAFRAKLIYHLSHEYSPWWFDDSSIFINQHEFSLFATSIAKELGRNRKKEVYLIEHYNKYNNDNRKPPAWKTLEVLSLGTLSKMYGNLSTQCKAKDIIAYEFGTVNHTYLHSWLQDLTQIRNICAHHGRIWNKNLPGRPKLLPKPPHPWLKSPPPVTEHHMLYVHLCCMKYILNTVNPGNNLTYRLYVLLKNYPNIDLNALGMPKDWYKEAVWRNKAKVSKPLKRLYYKMKFVFSNRLSNTNN